MEKKVQNIKQLHIPLILRDLWRNVWLIVLAAAIGCMGLFIYNARFHQPEYESTVTLAVSPRANGSYIGFYSSLRTANEMAEVFKEVFSSDVLKRIVREDLNDKSLAVNITATVEEGTNILRLSTKADTPIKAHQVMQSVLRNYPQVSTYMFGSVVLDTIKSPHVPTEPINSLNMSQLYCVAAILSMVVMAGAIAALSFGRATLKTLDGAKHYMGHPPLGVLIHEKSVQTRRKRGKKGLLIWMSTVSFRYTEATLRIAHKLRHVMSTRSKKVLLITSVAENEGKSTLAANLAIAMAKHGSRVAVVDMDLRRPALHKLFSETDLCTSLQDAMDTGMPLKKDQKLYVFTTEGFGGNAGVLLHDAKLEAFLRDLRKEMDYIILDSAPYTAVADTGMLLKYADGCIMSVRQDWVPHKVLRSISEELDQENADYLGYVLAYYVDNGITDKTQKSRYNYYET